LEEEEEDGKEEESLSESEHFLREKIKTKIRKDNNDGF
jgi:hypothetical protein